MSDQGSNGRISVSEDKLRALFAEFKLELSKELEKMATLAALEMIDARVKVLELWQAGITASASGKSRIFEGWFKWATLVVAALGTISGLIYALAAAF